MKMNLHSEKTIRFSRNAMNSHIMAEAVKSGTKKTAATAVIAKRVGVDRKSLKDFVEGDVSKPSKRCMQKYVDWLGKNPETTMDPRDEKPQPTPKEITTSPVAKRTALLVTDDEVAMLIGLLQASESAIRDDYTGFEEDQGHEWGREISLASYQAMYRQEGLLKRLRKKIESQSPCQFRFDTELQSVVPLI
jgi:hypothetical protein